MNMTVNDSLKMLADDLGLPTDAMLDFPAENKIGGWNEDPAIAKWPCGSIWDAEAAILYSLVRALKPAKVIEVGVHKGCSSQNILAAMCRNRKGKLHSYDLYPIAELERFTAAQKKRWDYNIAYFEKAELTDPVDIVFDDAYHDTEFCIDLIHKALPLNPRIIISHDGEHESSGPYVQAAYETVFGVGGFKTFTPGDAKCGFAYWVSK